jgi:hypothetical protein
MDQKSTALLCYDPSITISGAIYSGVPQKVAVLDPSEKIKNHKIEF